MDSVGPALDKWEEQAASPGPLHSSGWQQSLSQSSFLSLINQKIPLALVTLSPCSVLNIPSCLAAGVCTPRLLLHAVCCRLSSEQGGFLIRFLENTCSWVLLVCFSCQSWAYKVLVLFTTLRISSDADVEKNPASCL